MAAAAEATALVCDKSGLKASLRLGREFGLLIIIGVNARENVQEGMHQSIQREGGDSGG